jgi:hypothetical protein
MSIGPTARGLRRKAAYFVGEEVGTVVSILPHSERGLEEGGGEFFYLILPEHHL